ncbi:MAG: FprA family A-type flavoprotein [Thermofilaceae archaeon]|nr:FprA family A-type flavoprotein [Thermofilaceae archaeon]MCX8180451.1 FprA family A-type flavoprotein [Thermofilaceae archaeon]MDW8003352.1 MBL fold metallo-hydrolase [Thermofilaceae archaeon]
MIIFERGEHKAVVFRGYTPPGHVQANQFLIVDSGQGLLADPGGRVVFNKLIAEMSKFVPPPRVKYLFFSHQDPDILGAAAVWYTGLENAKILLPDVWLRFLPHSFHHSIDLEGRVLGIPEEGLNVKLGECELQLIPAHFLHSPGNFQIYDPCLKLLYSGDLFASLFPSNVDYDVAESFESHVRYMEFFHRRYIPSQRAVQRWLQKVKDLEIEAVVPQHGAIIKGEENVKKSINWVSGIKGYLDD